MKELSLFTGAGGSILGTKLLGFTNVGYVEKDDYCQRVLRHRISDGVIDDAPIYSDIKTFISDGYAESYKGLVDLITAGFPCQPFSVAGKQRGEADDRNLWPETFECIRSIRPQYVLLENVPGLLSSTYVRRIFGDLAESGFRIVWRRLSAAEMGAPHKRDRVWIIANADTARGWAPKVTRPKCKNTPKPRDDGEKKYVANAECVRKLQQKGTIENIRRRAFSEGKSDGGNWWAIEPGMGRVAHGMANRVDRIKALGNGQVPAVVEAAWHLLQGTKRPQD